MTEIDETIGEKIRNIRKSLGVSQIELAERIGVSFQQIQKYEKGDTRITVFRLQQIANALKVSIFIFFPKESSSPPQVGAPVIEYIGNPEHAVVLNKEGTQLLKMFEEIEDPKVQKLVQDLLRALTKA